MDSSASALAFKGSVAEAIAEAKAKNEILLVYVSGTNEDSVLLEKSTWVDPNVAEAVLKHCVFLHLIQGSLDSINFSACYPIKAIPSISAVGYNGVLLWQSEGYTNPEKLLAGIQKAWSDLHSQEAAAAVLTAALVSNKSEEPSSSTSNASELLKASSEIADMPSLLNNGLTEGEQSTKWSGTASSKEECRYEAEGNDKSKGVPSSGMARDAQEDCFADDKRVLAEENDISSSPVRDMRYTGCEVQSISARPRSQPQVNINSNVQFVNKAEDPISKMNLSNSGFSYSETIVDPTENKPNSLTIQDFGADKENRASRMSSDVHLNIRLSDGASIRGMFSINDTLEMVKKYVDQNRTDGSGPYSLGIPYPRKLFNEQDMSKGLSELGFVGREALIVVPHNKSSVAQQRETASESLTASPSASVGSNDGRFGIVWKILSYFNPFSYFNGAPSSDEEPPNSGTGMWQYGPDPAAWSTTSTARPFPNYPSNAGASSSSGASGSKGKKTPPSWGSNVHTLRQEDDDTAFRDRNAFWNGNSTQYGGDDNK
ncbi:plant UBX domain-containing protein 11 isoform X2 [Nymphaea colorata]|uniref:plant UBX domain-containing protein 11 isoform X2 n=1 Tax=Nymphaea colorata TaxID=210225 RepID=UPI00129EF7F9|nr:plant UBX domain-containing protein 11 isoform X2 [Nymphaea colorata]